MTPQPTATAQPVVVDAYRKGFTDGVKETLDQLEARFDLSQIERLPEFIAGVREATAA